MRRFIVVLVLCLVVIGGLSACGSTAPTAPAVAPADTRAAVTNAPAASITATQAPAATLEPTATQQPPTEMPATRLPAGDAAALLSALPLPPAADFDEEQTAMEPASGKFRILAGGSLAELIDFYAAELPAQGWRLRETGANTMGGVIQRWQYEQVFLDLNFGYEQQALQALGEYRTVDPDQISMLPGALPLPADSEAIFTSENAWQFFSAQPFEEVVSYYESQMLATGWQAATEGLGGAAGEGDGDSGDAGRFPAGVTPMPTPTLDPRQPQHSSWIMADGQRLDLEIRPQPSGAIISIAIAPRQAGAAPWLADLPLYPGAELQIVDQSMLGYHVPAALGDIRKFYDQEMEALGWTKQGNPFAVGLTIDTWTKDEQTLMITYNLIDNTNTMVILAEG